MKRILALVPGLAMLSVLASDCAPTGGSDGGQSNPTVNTSSSISYTITTSNFDMGVYSFDTNVAYEQNTADALGVTLNVTNNEFTADKSTTQLQNQLASAPDRVAFLGISETFLPVTTQYYKDTETPYVFFACAPKDEDVVTSEQDEYYVGVVVYDPQGEEAGIAELALADGCKTAVTPAGASDDYTHDRRIIGFTEALEAGGGKVLFVSHSADPSEGVQETNDFLTAYPDVDCIYTCGNNYVAPAADVVKSHDLEGYKIYGADVGPSIYQPIMDSEVEVCSGGVFASYGAAVTLLVNYLDRNVIKDSEGRTPYFDSLELFTATSDNVGDFYKFLSDETLSTHIISDEEYQNLLVRNDTEINCDYYADFMTNYTGSMYTKVEANANRT